MSLLRPTTAQAIGTGLIGDFYTMTLGQRSRDRWDIPESTTDMKAAIEHPETEVVVIGLPNFLHEEAISPAAAAGKSVL